MRFCFAIISFLFASLAYSQQIVCWAEFTDKQNNAYSLNNPEAFLSEAALSRRANQNIALIENDLPVSGAYLDSLKSFPVSIKYASKWLNGVVFYLEEIDSTSLELIASKPYIKRVLNLRTLTKHNQQQDNKFNEQLVEILAKPTTEVYGYGANQIEMLNGHYLHNLGYKGNGVQIAVMDNGFNGVNTNQFFAKGINNNSIMPGYNYVDDTSFVFQGGRHGTLVLSTIKPNEPNVFIATAPESNTYLFVTEDDESEGLLEEIYWAIAAEAVDSFFGNQAIITTSLGYSNGFSYGLEYEHSYQDMDGNTTLITKAADIAASKGILVINSAGNEGSSSWNYITAPADGDSVLAIGAVNSFGEITSFSSRGPAYDNDLKPNLCAQGSQVVGVNEANNLVEISGTSFSCPISSGLAACLWQAFPNKTAWEIKQSLEQSANLFSNPNNDCGYGIPDFNKAFLQLANSVESFVLDDNFLIYPNPFNEVLNIVGNTSEFTDMRIELIDLTGHVIEQHTFNDSHFNFSKSEAFQLNTQIQKGIYFLRLVKGKQQYVKKIVKH